MERRSVFKAGLVLIATTTAAAIFRPVGAAARILTGGSPWPATGTPPPSPVSGLIRHFFTEHEERLVTAIFDRLIPADELSISASQAGCVVFVDHQLAGAYGRASTRYLNGPWQNGSAAQGNQDPMTPAQCYRQGLAELDAYCQHEFGERFDALAHAQQDGVLEQMEAGRVPLGSVSSAAFFRQLLANVQEGFFADPIYGGNRDMVGWKMIGFPGARYDYRDYVQRKGERLDIAPVSIAGRL
jgi:gluconate 2-dehydrogenase gamma chain